MKFAFFGTDEFATIILNELEEKSMKPVVVVCAPDMPMRRKTGLVPPPVKVWAQTRGISVLQPGTLDTDTREILEQYGCDFFVVASYGKIIPQSFLDIPPKGILNVHPSLLPLYRGASPIESAILDDQKQTGVTIMEMDSQMDHGPIVAQSYYTFEKWPHGPEARRILAHEGGRLLAETIPAWLDGSRIAVPQNHSQATFTKKFEKEDAFIDVDNGDSYMNFRKIQAFYDWYNAYFFTHKDGVLMRVVVRDASFDDAGLHIHTVIPEGKKEMTWQQFQNFLKQ